jgi:hypothetical protein
MGANFRGAGDEVPCQGVGCPRSLLSIRHRRRQKQINKGKLHGDHDSRTSA